jgi:hypothetical protein
MLRRGAACAAVMLVVALAPLPIARAYHDRSVGSVTGALMSAPRVAAAVSPGASESELRVDFGDLGPDPTQTAYLDVEIDLEACPEGVPLMLRYDPSDPFQDFSIVVQPQPRGTVVQRYMTPVFRGFRGLSTGMAPASCIRRVERLSSVKGIALLPTYTLPANWRDMAPHQSVGWAALRISRLGR